MKGDLSGEKTFPPLLLRAALPILRGHPATPRLRARRFSRAPSVMAAFRRARPDRAVPAAAPESHPSLKLARFSHLHGE